MFADDQANDGYETCPICYALIRGYYAVEHGIWHQYQEGERR